MAPSVDARLDAELLAACGEEPEAFAELYRRHEAIVAGYLVKRTQHIELAADLTAETFATALVKAHTFRANDGAAVGWLLGIARNLMLHSLRRGRAEDRARRRLGMDRSGPTDHSIARLTAFADDPKLDTHLSSALDALPDDQREAVVAFVIDEQSYADLASQFGLPESTVRKRVSRGLARLRGTLQGEPS